MSKTQTNDEFFIGWVREVPPYQRRFLYHRLIGIFVFVFSLGLLIPFMQKRYEPSFYKYMSKENFEGVFVADPVPSLLVSRPGTIGDNLFKNSLYLLVNPNKNGFDQSLAEELNGMIVQMKGALIFNKEQTLIEAVPKSIQVIENEEQANDAIDLTDIGKYKLSGEIVDSKSYYGAINPGFGKPARACAVRSIANGVPPLLLIKSESGETLELIVLGEHLESLSELILDRVSVPVNVTGIVSKWGDKYIIKTSDREIVPIRE